MAGTLSKRKHSAVDDPHHSKVQKVHKAHQASRRDVPRTDSRAKIESTHSQASITTVHTPSRNDHATSGKLHVQIVTGSYERILHGLVASVTLPAEGANQSEQDSTSFSDTFLFSAHSSSVRAVAFSPAQASKRILATGSADERINLYHVATTPPLPSASLHLPTLMSTAVAQNPRNRELGSLLHHSRTITSLQFPTKTKLFSSSEDNTIGVTRTRDWTTLSTIKAPVPKAQGRPSGDTAAPGDVPSGVNDFAIHPSMKLMLSVSKGERCMRLWNLVTGKKAGVLNFGRELLTQVGEGRFGTGEGRKVLWRPDGEGFLVAFERGAVIYGMDSVASQIIRIAHGKICEARFVPGTQDMVAISTEDGRVLFYPIDRSATASSGGSHGTELPECSCFAEIPSLEAKSSGRIKDFVMLEVKSHDAFDSDLICITASSDGAIRLWLILRRDLNGSGAGSESKPESPSSTKSVGKLLGVRETGNRLTCLAAFVMDPSADDHTLVRKDDSVVDKDDVASSDSNQ